MKDEEISHGEIVIVKRGGGGHDDGHHGGVWKIAFADFMTAMMAFFLVMWLINASNEKTKKAVASYFNPIKLMDKSTSPKGIRNPEEGADLEVDDSDSVGKEEGAIVKSAKAKALEKTEEKEVSERALFIDPYAILSEIAGGITETESGEQRTSDVDENQMRRIGISGGKSFQDPFDPTSWSRQAGLPKDPLKDTTPENRMGLAEGQLQVGEDTKNFGIMQSEDSEELEFKDEQEETSEEREETPDEQTIAEVQSENETSGSEKATDEQSLEESEQLAEKIRNEIADQIDGQDLSTVDLEIVSDGDGVAVILSDRGQNGMFTIGSAKPTPQLVNAMEKIGTVIAEHENIIEISGHTDGRQYQSADYDNWRLSSARAQMAYYMLVRGGMNESQVSKISGQAAVRLKIPEDPYAAANRRIEVYLKLSSS